jgi:amidohydrolase
MADWLTKDSTAEGPYIVLPEIEAMFNEMVENRRYFHSIPELAFEEYKTAAHIASLLRSYGITEIYEKVGKTGVVAVLRGSHPGKTILLRADIDGLPVQETADVSYKSTHENRMHCCGHDAHITMLLAAAKILAKAFAVENTFKGNVKLIFQPAEEGFGGAREMIKDGVLEEGPVGPYVDEVYGIHIWSMDKLGFIGCTPGPIMAASDKFTVTINGSGGHGAAPHEAVDAMIMQANLINAFQTIISRSTDPLERKVLTVGTIKGGHGYNIIADKVEIGGTCRSFTPETQEKMKTRMHEICNGVAATFGGQISMDYSYGYPPTINHSIEAVEHVRTAAAPFVGEKRACGNHITCGAEDFSYYLNLRKGCFYFVGAQLEGPKRPHHKSVFDIDERAMMIGSSTFLQLTRDRLK